LVQVKISTSPFEINWPLVVFIKHLFWYYILTPFFPGNKKSENRKKTVSRPILKEFAQLLLKIVVMKLNSKYGAFVKLNMFVMTFKKSI
jgi:hypothetical protein